MLCRGCALDVPSALSSWLIDGTADWLWPAAERTGIPLMVLMPGVLDHLRPIAERHSELRLVLDHVGFNVRGKEPRVFEDLPAVCAFAQHPNIVVKTSGRSSFDCVHHDVGRCARGRYRRCGSSAPRSQALVLHENGYSVGAVPQSRILPASSLLSPWADTTTNAGKMRMTIFAGIAKFERDLIQERTTAGRIAAQKRGFRFGRPQKLNADQEKLTQRLMSEGKGVPEIVYTFL